MPITNSVCEKVWFTINGLPKMLLFNLCLFHFSIFQMTIVKNVMEKPFFFIMDIVDFYEILLRRKYFRSTYFWQWNNGSSKIFCFISLFPLNESNVTTSFLMIHLKCTVVHYSNLNPSSINNPLLRDVEYATLFFFDFFNEAFVENFMKELSLFNANFQNSFQDVVDYRILRCQNLWY